MDLRIAVIIPVHNAERFVGGAVASALAFPEVTEVVLVEDGGTDGSLAVCEALVSTDPRIRLVRHPDGGNHGAGASRNLGFANSTAPFIVFLDADDRFLPNRFDRERELFAKKPDADGIYGATGVEYHDPAARDLFRSKFKQELTTVNQEVPPEQLFSALLGKIKDFGYACMLAYTIRRTAIERLGLPFYEDLRLHQDTAFLLRLAHGARLYPGELKEPIALRGVHPQNRITASRSPAVGRHLLYRRLEAWSKEVEMSGWDRRVLVAKRVYWGIFLCKGIVQRLGYARWFIRYPWLFSWVQVREAYINALFGKGSLMARALIPLTWRMSRNVLTHAA